MPLSRIAHAWRVLTGRTVTLKARPLAPRMDKPAWPDPEPFKLQVDVDTSGALAGLQQLQDELQDTIDLYRELSSAQRFNRALQRAVAEVLPVSSAHDTARQEADAHDAEAGQGQPGEAEDQQARATAEEGDEGTRTTGAPDAGGQDVLAEDGTRPARPAAADRD